MCPRVQEKFPQDHNNVYRIVSYRMLAGHKTAQPGTPNSTSVVHIFGYKNRKGLEPGCPPEQ